MSKIPGDTSADEGEYRGDVQRPAAFNNPPELVTELIGERDEEKQQVIEDKFTKLMSLDKPNALDIYESRELNKLRLLAESKGGPQQICHFLDKKIRAVLENGEQTEDLEKFLFVAYELTIGQTFEQKEDIPAVVTIRDQYYFLKDYEFYLHHRELYDLVQGKISELSVVSAEVRYSSVLLYSEFRKALVKMGIDLPEELDLEHFQPNVKYISSMAVGRPFNNEDFQQRIFGLAERFSVQVAKPEFPVQETYSSAESEEIYANMERAQRLFEKMLREGIIEDNDPSLIEGYISLIRSRRDKLRCRLYIDGGEEFDSIIARLKSNVSEEDILGKPRVLVFRQSTRIGGSVVKPNFPNEQELTDPARQVSEIYSDEWWRTRAMLITAIYAGVHCIVPTELYGRVVEMEVTAYPYFARSLRDLLHVDFKYAGKVNLYDRGLHPYANARQEHAIKGAEGFASE